MGKIVDAWNDLNRIRDKMADPNDQGPEAAVGRAVCDAYGSAPGAVAAGLATVGASSLPLNYACGPYWAGEGYDPPAEETPLVGGQCSVPYDIFISRDDDCTGSEESRTSNNAPGPITVTNWTRGDEAPESTEECPLWIWSSSFTTATGGGDRDRVSTNAPTWRVERDDGLPDDCGDQEPVLVPGPNPPPSRPFGDPVDSPVGGSPTPITVNPPTSDPYGEPYIPVDVDGDPWYFLPSPSMPSIPDQNPPERPPIESPPSEPAGDVEDEPVDEPEDDTLVCIGVTWDFYDIPNNRGGINGANPKRFYETFASIQLAAMTSEGNVFWLDQRVINTQKGSYIRPDDSLEILRYSINRKPSFGPVRLRFLYAVAKVN